MEPKDPDLAARLARMEDQLADILERQAENDASLFAIATMVEGIARAIPGALMEIDVPEDIAYMLGLDLDPEAEADEAPKTSPQPEPHNDT